jgi:DNA-binding transcriptional LysR family regulator
MELRHLRYFVAVAEALHFGQAAAALHIAQPSLSHQIKLLEAEVKTTLLHRTKRRVELTDAGRLFFEEARDILARADRAAMIARRAGRATEGRLRVGVGYCMDQARISEAASAFNVRHPAIRVELQTIAVPLQLDGLRGGTLDVGFVRPPITNSGLASERLMTEPLVAALPANHRLARKRSVPLSDFSEESFILPPREAVPVYYDIALKACREAGFVPDSPHEADHLHMLLAMVGGGSGVALVPAFARRLKPPRVVFLLLKPPPASLDLLVAWRRDNDSRAVVEFLKVVREQLADGRAPRAPQRNARANGR